MPFIWSPTLAASGSFFDSAPNAADIPIKATAMTAVTKAPLLSASGSIVPITQIAPAIMRIAPAIFKKVSPMLSAYCAFLAFAISFNASEMPLAALDRAYTERTRTTLLYSFKTVSPVWMAYLKAGTTYSAIVCITFSTDSPNFLTMSPIASIVSVVCSRPVFVSETSVSLSSASAFGTR